MKSGNTNDNIIINNNTTATTLVNVLLIINTSVKLYHKLINLGIIFIHTNRIYWVIKVNLNVKRVKNSIIKQKRLYFVLIGLMIVAVLSGILFWFVISNEDKLLVTDELTSFFTSIKDGSSINYFSSLLNSIITNLIYVILIWLLGISIIGLPIILFMLAIKSFIVGFSISSIVATYSFKGLLGAITYTFPHQIIFLLLLVLLGFYAISFCIKLFKYLFLKQIINFKDAMRRYLKILIISCITAIVISLFETFISTYFIKLFTLLI